MNPKLILNAMMAFFPQIINAIADHLPGAGPDKRAGIRMVEMLGDLGAQTKNALSDKKVDRAEMVGVLNTMIDGLTAIKKELSPSDGRTEPSNR